jgi:acyl carrier protein
MESSGSGFIAHWKNRKEEIYMENLMKILKEIRPDVDFEKEDRLIDGDILDSFDWVKLVSEIDEAFGIEVQFEDLVAENFNSVDNIWALINKLAGE